MSETERRAIWIILGFLLAMVLAGCATDRIEVDPEVVAAHELVGFDWCRPAERLQCPMIRQGNEMFLLQPGQTIGDGARVWDVLGVTVNAFSEDE